MSFHLVADIGGTNSRFALCEAGSLALHEARKYPNANFASLQDAIAHYFADVNAKADAACLAVAGPAHGEKIALTNIDWTFEKRALAKDFAWQHLIVTNDFTALAMAVPTLDAGSYDVVGGGQALAGYPVAIVGPGTGLGVSALLPQRSGDGWLAIQGEGGNAAFAPENDLELELFRLAKREKEFVRTEDFISGNGLSYLHDLLLEIDGKPRAGVAAKDITWRAKSGGDSPCARSVDVFCGLLGSFAGNMALTFGALGGVYIGGGMVPQLEHVFVQSSFRERFEAKGRFKDYVSAIATRALHAHSRYALMGAAAILKQELSDA